MRPEAMYCKGRIGKPTSTHNTVKTLTPAEKNIDVALWDPKADLTLLLFYDDKIEDRTVWKRPVT